MVTFKLPLQGSKRPNISTQQGTVTSKDLNVTKTDTSNHLNVTNGNVQIFERYKVDSVQILFRTLQ